MNPNSGAISKSQLSLVEVKMIELRVIEVIFNGLIIICREVFREQYLVISQFTAF